jgi:hypothetical protein
MKIKPIRPFILIFVFLAIFTVGKANAQNGKLYTVNDPGDSNDTNIGDDICADASGKCTLRAAIQQAGISNALHGISFALALPATIDLTLGELRVTSNVYIVGPGARKLTVQRSLAAGTPNFRVFNFVPAIKNGNLPDGDGGGIYIGSSNIITLSDVVVSENTANRGGGVFSEGGLSINRSLIYSNTAVANQAGGGAGGGFYALAPFAITGIVNSTFTQNNAVEGGSIYHAGRSLFLINDTISHNNAANLGCSIVNIGNGNLTVLNTIVGMDSSASVSSLSGAFVSYGNNLITDARNSTGFTNNVNSDQVSNNNSINPLLGVLADNGGQTDSRILLAGSPAINQGNNCIYYSNCPSPIDPRYYETADQRSKYLRLSGSAVDVGAYESQSSIINASGTLTYFFSGTRNGGNLAILTNTGNNEQTARLIKPFGAISFNNILFGEYYFIETRYKSSGERGGIGLVGLEILPLTPLNTTTLEKDGMQIKWNK